MLLLENRTGNHIRPSLNSRACNGEKAGTEVEERKLNRSQEWGHDEEKAGPFDAEGFPSFGPRRNRTQSIPTHIEGSDPTRITPWCPRQLRFLRGVAWLGACNSQLANRLDLNVTHCAACGWRFHESVSRTSAASFPSVDHVLSPLPAKKKKTQQMPISGRPTRGVLPPKIANMSDSTKLSRHGGLADDDVLATRFFDDTSMVKVVMRWMIRVDNVLDADKLHKSLARLLETGNWRRLGGRLRVNSANKLEIHVPKVFTSDRPAVRFNHLVIETDIGSHPLAGRLPQPTEGPSIQEGGDSFRELGALGGYKFPETLQDYFGSDEPSIALQVISFRDATLVSINFPHAVTDAVGLSSLIDNWCKVLAGREDEVLPLPADDPMDRIDAQKTGVEEPKVEHVLKDKQLTGFGLVVFGLHFLFDLLFGPKMQTRVVFLPARSVGALKKRAISDLELKAGDSAKSAPFVSDGDILTALGTKSVAASLGENSTRSLTVLNVFELRSRFPASNIFDTSKFAHVQNAFFVLTCILSGQEARKLSLGQVALRMRQALVEQTAEPQIRALVRDARASLKTTGRPALYAEKNSMLMPVSNWSKGRFYDVVDFGPAVLDPACGKERRGKPSFFVAFESSPKKNPTYRNVWNILGKDPKGNYWITGMLSPATWEKMEEELNKL